MHIATLEARVLLQWLWLNVCPEANRMRHLITFSLVRTLHTNHPFIPFSHFSFSTAVPAGAFQATQERLLETELRALALPGWASRSSELQWSSVGDMAMTKAKT